VPVGPLEADAMLQRLRTYPLLEGFRGRPAARTEAVVDVLMRISALASAHHEVAELDCNPVIAGPGGAVVADARVRVETPPGPTPYAAVGRT
jgi:hypothetical protein